MKWTRTCSQRSRFGEQPDHERQTHKKPLFPTDLQNLMPHLDVCDPIDCRVAFISRGQPQELAGVCGQRRKCSPVVALSAVTGNQQAVDDKNQRARWPTYMRSTGLLWKEPPGYKVAWIERRTSLSLRKIIASLGFRASHPRVERTSHCLWVLEHHGN
jgi:hypothetical protein